MLGIRLFWSSYSGIRADNEITEESRTGPVLGDRIRKSLLYCFPNF